MAIWFARVVFGGYKEHYAGDVILRAPCMNYVPNSLLKYTESVSVLGHIPPARLYCFGGRRFRAHSWFLAMCV